MESSEPIRARVAWPLMAPPLDFGSETAPPSAVPFRVLISVDRERRTAMDG